MNKKIIIVVLVLAIGGVVLFVITRPRHVFDFEGRMKLLDQIAKTQKEYPKARILVPDDRTKLPKIIPEELTYNNSKVVSVEQLGSQGISYVLISSDPKDLISKTISRVMETAGWEFISNSNDVIEAKKGVQKAKIFVEAEEDHAVITVAYTYDL